MSKELPYFQFTLQEWQNGTIIDLSDSAKGVFIDVCCFYWANNCEITEERLLERFKTKTKTIQKLIKSKVIKCQNGIVSISFLSQQLLKLNETQSFFSEMGKLGQKAKKKKAPLEPPLEPRLSYKKDKIDKKEKDNILKEQFDKKIEFNSFRIAYPGTGLGLDAEWLRLKKHNDYLEAVPLLMPALEREKKHKSDLTANGNFSPDWKNLSTWINQRCWEQKLSIIEPKSILGNF